MTRRFIPFAAPDLGESELAALREVLDSGWLTTGPKVQTLEREFAAFVGARYAVAVNSCTAAMHLALEAIGIRPDDEVIVPTMTFAATAGVVEHMGARPVLVDCLPDTLTIDPQAVERAITPRTRAIMPVHYAGHPCDMDALRAIAKKYHLFLVEDAAHALPAKYKGQMIGQSLASERDRQTEEVSADADQPPSIVCFSFYATKNLTTGEGGMLCTDSATWAERARMMSLHGITRDAWRRYAAEGSWYYEILAPGFKYNLPDLLAAVGLAQLKKLPRAQKRRREIVARYQAAFGQLDTVECPVERSEVEHAWHLYVLRLRLERLKISRNAFIEALRERGIGTSVHFIPLHVHPYYRERYGYRPEDFPIALDAYRRIISLPLYPAMSDEDVERVIDAVMDVARKNWLPR